MSDSILCEMELWFPQIESIPLAASRPLVSLLDTHQFGSLHIFQFLSHVYLYSLWTFFISNVTMFYDVAPQKTAGILDFDDLFFQTAGGLYVEETWCYWCSLSR